jgi:hypothetical protein
MLEDRANPDPKLDSGMPMSGAPFQLRIIEAP